MSVGSSKLCQTWAEFRSDPLTSSIRLPVFSSTAAAVVDDVVEFVDHTGTVLLIDAVERMIRLPVLEKRSFVEDGSLTGDCLFATQTTV